MKTDSLKEALLARDNAADDKKVKGGVDWFRLIREPIIHWRFL